MARLTVEVSLDAASGQRSPHEVSRALARVADDLGMHGFGEGRGWVWDDRRNAIGSWRVHGGQVIEPGSEFATS